MINPLATLVHGLQLACLFTWGSVLWLRGGAVQRVLVGSQEPADHRWAAIVMFAGGQMYFCLRWLVFWDTVDGMAPVELAWWAPAYLFGTITAVLVVWTQGTTNMRRNRAALGCHLAVGALSLVAASLV